MEDCPGAQELCDVYYFQQALDRVKSCRGKENLSVVSLFLLPFSLYSPAHYFQGIGSQKGVPQRSLDVDRCFACKFLVVKTYLSEELSPRNSFSTAEGQLYTIHYGNLRLEI
jgi:hypothetical protein